MTAPTPSTGQTENIAHRGASLHAPENTLAAFDLAVAMGANRVELDVQLSADGEVVVTHDPTLARTTDVARVFPDRGPWDLRSFTWSELRLLEVGRPDDSSRSGDGMPDRAASTGSGAPNRPDDRQADGRTRAGGSTVADAPADGIPAPSMASLVQVLDHLAARTRLLLELKDPGRHPGMGAAVAAVLASHDGWLDPADPERLIVQSFDPAAVEALLPLLPDHVRGAWLVAEEVRPDVEAIPDWASAVVVDHAVVTTDLVVDVHARGRHLHAYTVNDRSEMQRLCKAGVDGIITDDPGMLAHLLDPRAGRGPTDGTGATATLGVGTTTSPPPRDHAPPSGTPDRHSRP